MTTYDSTPIRIGHIAAIQETLRLNSSDMAWLLGATSNRWSSIVRDIRLTPEQLAEPCHALVLRWMTLHPTASPTLHAPEAGAFLAQLRDIGKRITAKSFALSLGWDATAGSRWLRHRAPIGPAGRRALSLLNHTSPQRLADNWRKWTANAAQEARLRGIDLGTCLGWTTSRNGVEAVL